MPPEDLIAALEKRPFEPFRVHLTDGMTYEVRHPDLMMVGCRSVVIGIVRPTSIEQPRPL